MATIARVTRDEGRRAGGALTPTTSRFTPAAVLRDRGFFRRERVLVAGPFVRPRLPHPWGAHLPDRLSD